MFNKNSILLTCVCALLLTSCVAPLVIGGGATVGALATREKGLGGAVSDSSLSTSIKSNLYKFDPNLYSRVTVNVQNGEVLLAGMVKDPMWAVEAEKLTWQVKGVKSVNNQIEVTDKSDISAVAKDSWITTQVKSKVLFLQEVQSLNYSIKTVNSTVYVMGIAQSKTEMDKVTDAARNTSGVKKVVCLVRLKDEMPN